MAKSLHEHAPAIPCGLTAFAQCIQRQHAQGVEHVGIAEPEREGMFFEQIHAACSVAGDLGIRRYMRIRRGMEDPDGRTAPDRSALVCFQEIVRILTTSVGQACAGAKPGIEAEIFYDFGPEELQIGLPVFERPDLADPAVLPDGWCGRGLAETSAHDGPGLRMTLEGLYGLGQRIWGIPAVIVGEDNDIFLSNKREKCISCSRNSF